MSLRSFSVSNVLLLDSEETLETLYGKLSKKAGDELRGNQIRPGCVKYEWNSTVWNLDDGT